jgi:hypothetical protein
LCSSKDVAGRAGRLPGRQRGKELESSPVV